jgi:hypothetical protein
MFVCSCACFWPLQYLVSGFDRECPLLQEALEAQPGVELLVGCLPGCREAAHSYRAVDEPLRDLLVIRVSILHHLSERTF